MLSGFLADAVVVLHFVFIVFVVLGALLTLYSTKVLWLHVPAFIWGVYVEFTGTICPLTHLENALRRAAGMEGYSGSFVERYLVPVIYPEALTWQLQWLLGTVLILTNLIVYGYLWYRYTHASTN